MNGGSVCRSSLRPGIMRSRNGASGGGGASSADARGDHQQAAAAMASPSTTENPYVPHARRTAVITNLPPVHADHMLESKSRKGIGSCAYLCGILIRVFCHFRQLRP